MNNFINFNIKRSAMKTTEQQMNYLAHDNQKVN